MIVLKSTFQSESPKGELSEQQFQDINTPLAIFFTTKFSSARQLKNRNKSFSTFLTERRDSQMYN